MKSHILSYKEVYIFENESNKNLDSLRIFLDVTENIERIYGVFEYMLMINDIDSLRMIIDTNKIDLNRQDEEGMTPIMHVIRHFQNKDDMRTINFLIDYGADLNIENKQGETGLIMINKLRRRLNSTNNAQ